MPRDVMNLLSYAETRPQYVGMPLTDIKAMYDRVDASYTNKQTQDTEMNAILNNLDVNKEDIALKEQILNDYNESMKYIHDNNLYEQSGDILSDMTNKYASNRVLHKALAEQARVNTNYAELDKKEIEGKLTPEEVKANKEYIQSQYKKVTADETNPNIIVGGHTPYTVSDIINPLTFYNSMTAGFIPNSDQWDISKMVTQANYAGNPDLAGAIERTFRNHQWVTTADIERFIRDSFDSNNEFNTYYDSRMKVKAPGHYAIDENGNVYNPQKLKDKEAIVKMFVNKYAFDQISNGEDVQGLNKRTTEAAATDNGSTSPTTVTSDKGITQDSRYKGKESLYDAVNGNNISSTLEGDGETFNAARDYGYTPPSKVASNTTKFTPSDIKTTEDIVDFFTVAEKGMPIKASDGTIASYVPLGGQTPVEYMKEMQNLNDDTRLNVAYVAPNKLQHLIDYFEYAANPNDSNGKPKPVITLEGSDKDDVHKVWLDYKRENAPMAYFTVDGTNNTASDEATPETRIFTSNAVVLYAKDAGINMFDKDGNFVQAEYYKALNQYNKLPQGDFERVMSGTEGGTSTQAHYLNEAYLAKEKALHFVEITGYSEWGNKIMGNKVKDVKEQNNFLIQSLNSIFASDLVMGANDIDKFPADDTPDANVVVWDETDGLLDKPRTLRSYDTGADGFTTSANKSISIGDISFVNVNNPIAHDLMSVVVDGKTVIVHNNKLDTPFNQLRHNIYKAMVTSDGYSSYKVTANNSNSLDPLSGLGAQAGDLVETYIDLKVAGDPKVMLSINHSAPLDITNVYNTMLNGPGVTDVDRRVNKKAYKTAAGQYYNIQQGLLK
jgi:hypothetical protein